jgi:nucleoside-diphosphate-sugar epimerase
MTQSAAAGRILSQIGSSTGYHYKPLSSDDLTSAVETAFAKFEQAKGKKFIINGQEETTLKNLLSMLEQAVGKPEGQTKLVNSFLRLNLSDYVEEFFVGITHDKNMRNMAEYFDAHRPNLSEGNTDFF